MPNAQKSINPLEYLGVSDSHPFSRTCTGHAIDTLLHLEKGKRVPFEELVVMREGVSALLLCLSDLKRDKDCRLHTEEDEADALTLIHSMSLLVEWIEEMDSAMAFYFDNPKCCH